MLPLGAGSLQSPKKNVRPRFFSTIRVPRKPCRDHRRPPSWRTHADPAAPELKRQPAGLKCFSALASWILCSFAHWLAWQAVSVSRKLKKIRTFFKEVIAGEDAAGPKNWYVTQLQATIQGHAPGAHLHKSNPLGNELPAVTTKRAIRLRRRAVANRPPHGSSNRDHLLKCQACAHAMPL